MRLKLIIFKIILSLFFISNNAIAKNLPPGSGISDVPANVLILLDKSGSMSARMTGGASTTNPRALAYAPNGDVFVGTVSNGIKKITYATNTADTSFANNGTFLSWTSNNCYTYYIMDMAYHNGFIYVASLYSSWIYRINATTGACDMMGLRIQSGGRPNKLEIKNNLLYFTNQYQGLQIYDISSSTPTQRGRNVINQSHSRYSYAMSIDASASNMYFYYNSQIYVHRMNMNIPQSNHYAAPRIYLNNVYGMSAHPTDDNIHYVSRYSNHNITKLQFTNSSKTSVRQITMKGRCCNGTSNASTQYLYYPYDARVDTNNNRVMITSYYGHNVVAYDLNLNFLKTIGTSPKSRMDGAHEAIKAIVTDSSLTAGVNFGFAYWSSGGWWWWGSNSSYGFTNWTGNITTGNATPCNSSNCLTVRAHKQGAQRINSTISSVQPGGGTDALAWAQIGEQYYLHNTYSPIDKNLSCQNSYLLVIGDGQWGNHSAAKAKVTKLLSQHKIKTFTVAYGGGLGSGINNFRDMAQAGGTNNVIVANTTASLKSQLKAAISQIIASKLSFTAPAITATIEKGGSLFQAQFDYVQNKEWEGTLTRTAISSSGVIDTTDKDNWSAAKMLPSPSSRKIWSEIPGKDYKTDYNNFIDSNYTQINSLFQLTNNEVPDYHSRSSNPTNTQRCKNTSGVANGNDDDIKGLINFVRGQDYFDYDGDCNLTETRDNPLGDIYHSEMVVVGNPSAETAFVGTNQEAYFRSINGYDSWAASTVRDEMIYVGANDGMLHAFNSKTGKEEWAFVPPFVAVNMPNMVNVNLNRSGVGGSNAIYGVDGSPVVHDMYFKSAYDTAKKWHTIMMVPYGRGGAGFSVLDVTNPKKPLHLYSVLNDHIQHTVHVIDHNGSISNYSYVGTSYGMSSFPDSINVQDNAQQGNGAEVCDSTGNNRCYKSKIWRLPAELQNVSASDLTVQYKGQAYTGFSVSKFTSGTYNGQSYIRFNDTMYFYGYNPTNAATSDVGIYLKPGSALTGVQSPKEYDYSQLGETWASPRIFRMPNTGAGDSNPADDIYVAVMGGGFGAQHSGFGSNLTIINLEDTTHPGKLEKVIPIEDLVSSDIINSTPGTPVVITPDTARGITYRGALVYLSDLEGKITKFNLTNMSDDGKGNAIKMYDSTTLFTAGSNSTNGRYMYHAMDATVGQTTNSLWLYAGTGDYERIGDTSAGIQNLMLGIADPNYPRYQEVSTPTKAIDLTRCKNTTNDTTGASCPNLQKDMGWYVILPNKQKVTAEPSVSSGLVYFPIYQPSSSVNKCSLGDAFICAADDECGTNFSSRLGKKRQTSDQCFYVGQGVLSRIVFFAGKLFANIAGQSTQNKKDLVTLDAASGDVSTYRSSWRHNF